MARGHGKVVALSLAGILAMAGLVVGSVPLYKLYCRVTGYGGTPRTEAAVSTSVSERMVTVRFDASLAKGLDWSFKPEQRAVEVQLGQEALAFFTATNNSGHAITGTATFNVTPDKAGRYFNKVQCFCFTEQRLEPGQSVRMPVTFWVDPALAADPNTQEIGTITLSYTFFATPDRQGRS